MVEDGMVEGKSRKRTAFGRSQTAAIRVTIYDRVIIMDWPSDLEQYGHTTAVTSPHVVTAIDYNFNIARPKKQILQRFLAVQS